MLIPQELQLSQNFLQDSQGALGPSGMGSFIPFMGKCCFRCIAYSGGKTFHAASFGILESSLQ